jgi:hypothetical protein
MHVNSAIELVNNLIYKPGWTFEATDATNRFEDAINVKITYPAQDSKMEDAPEYPNPIPGGARASFSLLVRDCSDTDLYRQVLQVIMKIEEHEAREFLRVQPTRWAPFHPHRVDGMRLWGDVDGDLQFGVV